MEIFTDWSLQRFYRKCSGIALGTFLAVTALQPLSALAENQDTILLLPDNQTVLTISATEQKEVQEDLLVATLSITALNSDSRLVQNEINQAMQKGLAEAKNVTVVESSTGSYQVYEIQDPRTKERKWQGRQTLVLKSKQSQALLELAGKIQAAGFTVSALDYVLDPATASSVQDELLEAALLQLQKRAARAAKALGKTSSELKEVTVLDSDQPMPRLAAAPFRMQMEAADMAVPVAQAGKSTVSLTVSARAILKP